MNNNKNTSFETKKKYEKKSNIYRIFKYKTYRNSQEKAQLKYYKKPKLKQIDKKINSLSLKANSKEKNLKKIYKPLYSYKITIKNFYKILNKDLRKYNFSHKKYNIQKSNEIIFDKNKRIVSIFKDYLLWNETSDFLKEYYQIPESISLLPNMCEYYEKYTLIYPEYGPLENVMKIMKRNMKKKKAILEKYEDNEENSILNKNQEDSSKKNKKTKKDEVKDEKFKKIINEKDLELESSKTYSHSKTCLNNEYKYFKENERNLSSIILDFFNIDEKMIGNYNYMTSKNEIINNDKEEKNIEKYFNSFLKNKNLNLNINKEKNHFSKKEVKSLKDINITEIKNKYKNNKYNKVNKDNKENKDNKNNKDNLQTQKLKLKNIFKIIKSSNNLKKINIKYLNEKLVNNKLIKNNEEKKSENKNLSINKKNKNEILSKNKQNIKLAKFNSKEKSKNSKSIPKKTNANTITNISIRKKNINPITSRPHNIKQLANSKFNKKNNNNNNASISNINKLILSKSKIIMSKSNDASKKKQTHRYQLLINKIFNDIQKNTQPRNYSDGQKYIKKKENNLKIKGHFKKKKNANIQNQLYNYSIINNVNSNNLISFYSLNKTSSEKICHNNNKKINIKKLNIKINTSKRKDKLNSNNFITINKKKKNPFILSINDNSNKKSSQEKSKIKNVNLNEYLSFSLTNRMRANKIDKDKLHFIMAKNNENENSHFINKSQNLVNFKGIKNQSCIRPLNNTSNINRIRKINNNEEKKFFLSNYVRDNLKSSVDYKISRNEEFFKMHKINNTIKLNNKERKYIRNLKNNNKKGGITSREKNKTRINSKQIKNGGKISNLKKIEILNKKQYKKYNDIKNKTKENNFNLKNFSKEKF